MRRLRVVTRAVVLSTVTASWAVLFLLGSLPALLAGRFESWRAFVFQRWARSAGWALRMRVERMGEAPREPVLLVANHLSYVDIVLIASCMPCVFVSKSEVGGWPVVGRLARWMQTLFVDRNLRRDVQRVADEIRGRLARGQSVVFFPEGTSTEGREVRGFHPALLEPAAREGWPVRHAALRYRTPEGSPPASEAVCWWGDMSFGPHLLALFALPYFDARISFGSEPIRDTDRKALARRLQREVASRFAALSESNPSCPIGV